MSMTPTVIAFAVYAAISFAVLQQINHIVTEPYMDEIFHIPQAQRYSQGDFHTWDPKLTTPPGLYMLSLVLLWPFNDSTQCLRNSNWVISLMLFWTIYGLVSQLHPRMSSKATAITTLSLSLFPVSFFLHHLYYTDTASLWLVLLTYSHSLRGRHGWAGVAGFVSLWLRQTNVVWVAFIAFSAIHNLTKQQGTATLWGSVGQLGKWWTAQPTSRHALSILVPVLLPYLLVMACFAVFLYINQGIVLGDKSHHQATMHLPQLFYFSSYVVGISAPMILPLASPRRTLFRHCLLIPVLAVFLYMCVQSYTIEHPFLLSDNRHYPFYIWKNIFRRHPMSKYATIPFYIYAMFTLNHVIDIRKTSTLWKLALAVCTAAVLVPSPLLEFRYFTVPYYFVRLHLSNATLKSCVFEIAWFALINSVTIWIFLYRPFTWDSEPDQLQRFMW